jgi:hypothetical protein
MGSKAEYEARKAAKRAKQAAEAAAQRPAGSEAHVIQAAEAAPGADQELRYRDTFTAERAAYQAAGLAKLTPLIILTKTEHPIGDMLLSRIFPEHQDSHGIGFCVTVEPGRITSPSASVELTSWLSCVALRLAIASAARRSALICRKMPGNSFASTVARAKASRAAKCAMIPVADRNHRRLGSQ